MILRTLSQFHNPSGMELIVALFAFFWAMTAGHAANIARPNLIGVWALKGDNCEGDNGITYRGNGTWDAYNAGGRWTIHGGVITTMTERRGEPDEAQRKVVPPERHKTIILSISKNSFSERWEDGSIRHFRRCR